MKNRVLSSRYLLYFLFLICLFIGLSFIPLSIDYQHYLTTTRDWLTGKTQLFDDQSTYFYYMPWSLLITAPLSIIPDRWGQAILSLISVIGILLSIRLLVGAIQWWAIFMVLTNLFTLNLLFSGQWDGLILAAVGVGWWCIRNKHPWGLAIALVLMSTKPTNIWLVGLLFLIYIIKKWQIRDVLKTISLPVLIIISSFLISGLDWPARYLRYVNNYPIPIYFNQSTWHHVEILSLHTWVMVSIITLAIIWFIYTLSKQTDFIDGAGITFSILINLLVSNYVTTYHYVATMPAFGWLSKKKWYLAVFMYFIMIIYFLGVVKIIKTPPYIYYMFSILFVCMYTTLEQDLAALTRRIIQSMKTKYAK